ncbi:MAG: MFS transporter [Alphaproteobacteria bacterium]|nr:MFS transporter [Alphaproteobacteria bacterium]
MNPEIAAAALVVDGQILIHTDSYMVGRPWEGARGHYEYLVDISPSGSQQEVNISVILPQEIVYWQTVRSVKNFAALFIASAFLASLFLQLAGTVNQRDGPHRKVPDAGTARDEERTLKLVKPVFYVTMCVEHLSYAFLASYIDGIVDASGLAASLTSTVFTVYYLCFALTLIPAGHLAQQFSPKPLMIFGLFLTAISFLLLLSGDIGLLVLARSAAGIGQAMLFIGVQSYIFGVAAPGRKTQGAAIIVYGFQGGMISGMAIGSLLVTYIGPSGVFIIGAVTTIFTLIYAVAVVPAITQLRSRHPQGLKASVATLGEHVLQAIRDRHLLQAIALVGIPAKAILTGIVVFAIPLLMARQGYRQEDIGQLLMLYAGGVVLTNELIARWVDRTGDTRAVLVAGALLSGAGLWLIGLLGWGWFDQIPYGAAVEVAFVVAGVVLLGAAHGLINAPIVSHVAALKLGERIGVSALTATYRFLERIGHIAGPLVVGQMFFFAGEGAIVLAWSGLVVAALGIVFLWLNWGAKPAKPDRHPMLDTGVDHINGIVGLHLDHHHQAIVLAVERTQSPADADPAQSLLMHHLDDRGNVFDSEALAALLASPLDASTDVSTVVANRRRALRFKRFLSDAAAAAPGQPFLVIACTQHLRYCASDLANWLQSRAGSRLVVLPNAEVWLDQMRGWLVLSTLDSHLGADCRGAEDLMAALQDYLTSAGDDDLAQIGPVAVQPSKNADERGCYDPSRATLHVVGE